MSECLFIFDSGQHSALQTSKSLTNHLKIRSSTRKTTTNRNDLKEQKKYLSSLVFLHSKRKSRTTLDSRCFSTQISMTLGSHLSRYTNTNKQLFQSLFDIHFRILHFVGYLIIWFKWYRKNIINEETQLNDDRSSLHYG